MQILPFLFNFCRVFARNILNFKNFSLRHLIVSCNQQELPGTRVISKKRSIIIEHVIAVSEENKNKKYIKKNTHYDNTSTFSLRSEFKIF